MQTFYYQFLIFHVKINLKSNQLSISVQIYITYSAFLVKDQLESIATECYFNIKQAQVLINIPVVNNVSLSDLFEVESND